jgi:hypothetical protein
MSLAVQITYVSPAAGPIRIGFKLVKSGNYVTAVGGDTVDFTKATADPSFVGTVPAIEALGAPLNLDVWDVSGNLATVVVVTIGTTQANSKVQLETGVNTELGSGAYPSPMNLQGEAVFNRL